ncbi:hypothetical protein PUR71_40375 [Streptomyces sp. SP17BM10]|uniref:hypothetical protein n=1 Tax=Streptomyces sp. SP17BM10 TaxID=3002530 RepID=UPI002E7A8896|nr:hypothetical protein [Streptomyces sp. SP17BM10]MEE1789117.1 hypothetical protein [Streptomyces sp. SP17BM10]
MTTPTIGAPAGVLRAALQLYPSRYRRERGDEMTAVFADATAEADRAAVAREVFDLAAYGLRLRLGLTGSGMLGRVLALAAPMVAGALAGSGLVPWVTDPDGASFRLTWDHSYTTWATTLAPPVTALLLAIASVLGRWTAVRVIASVQAVLGLGVLAQAFTGPSFIDLWWAGYVGMATMPAALAAALLLAAPTELLPRANWRTRGMVLASIAGGAGLVWLQRWDDTTFPLDAQWFALLLIVPVLLTFTALRGKELPAALGVAVLSLTTFASLFNIWREAHGISQLLPVAVPAIGLMVIVAVAMHRIGRGGTGGPGGDAEEERAVA